MTLPNVIYQGSVKNVRGVKGKSPYIFEFSDRYSIFDWGEMPDHLEGKGEFLAFMAWFFFDFLGNPKNWKGWDAPTKYKRSPILTQLKETGAAHHSIAIISHDLRTLPLDREIMSPSRCLSVHPIQVLRPQSRQEKGKLIWDYEVFEKKPETALVPLEVIFRFGVPEGSSLLKRTGDAEYCKSIGLDTPPKAGDKFDLPVIELSTKLENGDRYISYEEAQNISGMTEAEFKNLKELAAIYALRLKDCFAGIDVELWDGKLEFAFGKKDKKGGARALMLVDFIGPDELRLIYKGMHMSKEILRLFYRPTAWHEGIDKAKGIAKKRGEKDWKRICMEELKLVPPMLSPAVKRKAEMVYKGLCKALSQKYHGKAVFPDAWSLDEVVKSFSGGTSGKTILLLGSGGREHAMAWKMAQSATISRVVVLPGSDGMSSLAKVECVKGDPSDPAAVLKTAKELKPDLIVIGPEKPLAAGVSDKLEKAGFAVLGPTQTAARLESSKIFAKEFMDERGIPTAECIICDNHKDALAALKKWPVEKKGVVIKADGLASGKGVVVTNDRAEALKTINDFMVNPECAVKSARILLEEKLEGREVSAFALCDGRTFLPLGYACDYKRVRDGDEGPNTGGMGGYVPHNWPSEKARAFINNNIFKKVVEGMRQRGAPYRGILFAGLMIKGDDVKVIEFNVRLGDPETQILLPMIEDDIVPIFEQAAHGNLEKDKRVSFKQGASVHVVMASEGYPETFGTGMKLGEKISLPENLNDNALLFIAGAEKKDGEWVNAGGRVLGVTATGKTMEEARANAYDAIGKIHFNGAHWRKDIGQG